MNADVLSRVPGLLDHAEYGKHLQRLSDLEQRVVAAKNELVSLGEGPQIGADSESDADLDAALKLHLKEREKHEAAKLRAQLKVGALQHALEVERARTPELRKQAETFVESAGREACAEAAVIAKRAKQQLTDALGLLQAVSQKTRRELNRQSAGYTGFRYENINRPPNISFIPSSEVSALHQEGVAAGQSLFKTHVSDVQRQEFRSLAGRFERILRKFV